MTGKTQPDFNRLVRDRLTLPALARRDTDSVIDEVAAQMEDCYRDARARGVTEDEAVADALELVDDWEELTADIVGSVGSHRGVEADRWLEGREEELRASAGRLGEVLADLGRDLRLAARMLRRRPGFSPLVLLSLTIGLGAATAIFSITNGILYKPLPIADPDRVVSVWNGEFGSFTYPAYSALRRECASFVDLAARDETWFADDGADPLFLRSGAGSARVRVGLAAGNYFSVLGVPAARGRLLRPEDNRIEDPRAVAVLSHTFWHETFHGESDVIGTDLDISGTTFQVIGVAAEGFDGADHRSTIDVWVPAVMARAFQSPESETQLVRGDSFHWVSIVGRLKPGVSLEQVRERVDTIAGTPGVLPGSMEQRTITVRPIMATTVHPLLRERTVAYLTTLMLAVGLVLVVVGVNVTNLHLARMEERRAEIAIRRALGAGSGALLRQHLFEGGLLALAGGAGALLCSVWLDDILLRLLARGISLPGTRADIDPDLRVIAFMLGLVIISGLVMGVIPALRTRRSDITLSLRPGSRITDVRPRRPGLQSFLVIGQLTLSLVLLTGAGLLLRSVLALSRQDPGFDSENVLILSLHNEQVPLDPAAGAALYAGIAERVRSMPGVEDVSLATVVPLSGQTWGGRVEFEGYEPGPDEGVRVAENYVEPGFFHLLGIPLRRGRDFTDADAAGTQRVAIVNESLARRYWPDEDPVGQTVRCLDPPVENERIRVIGVVADHYYSHLRQGVVPLIYHPLAQVFVKNPNLLVKTTSDPYRKMQPIRAAVLDRAPRFTIHGEISLEDQIRRQTPRERATMILLVAFAGIALVLALLGTYGIVAGFVTRRRREIGVRLALGARNGEVVGYIFGRGMRLIVIGVIAGLVLSLLATRIFTRLIFGISPTDPVTLIAVSLVLAGAGALACLVPARRAVRIDPIETLRAE